MALRRDHPRPKVKLTLTLAMQNKLLGLLNDHFGINESYDKPHVIYVSNESFAKFTLAVAAAGHKITVQALKAEQVDMNKEPVITVVRGKPGAFYSYQPLGATHEGDERHL